MTPCGILLTLRICAYFWIANVHVKVHMYAFMYCDVLHKYACMYCDVLHKYACMYCDVLHKYACMYCDVLHEYACTYCDVSPVNAHTYAYTYVETLTASLIFHIYVTGAFMMHILNSFIYFWMCCQGAPKHYLCTRMHVSMYKNHGLPRTYDVSGHASITTSTSLYWHLRACASVLHVHSCAHLLDFLRAV